MTDVDPTLSLPFDQYQRYRLVAEILERARGDRGALEVLDVGGRTALLRAFLPRDRVHLVDLEASEEADLVLGDGASLPFADSSVDAVVTIDTLEHVPPGGRERFLAECARVARRWVVIAGPFATEGVAEAEAHLSTFLQNKLGIVHRYLAEHHEHGLPELEETEARLCALGGSVSSVGHANLERWLALMCLSMYVDRDAPLRAIATRFHRFYNAALFALDQDPPVYRHAVVSALEGFELPELEGLAGDVPAPSGTFEAFGHLTTELIGFDVERDVIKREWARLEEVNHGLAFDLEQHESTLAECREIRDEQRGVIDELRQRNEELRGNEQRLEEEVERERADGERAIATLAADLAEHRAKLAELEEELERYRELLPPLEERLGEQEREIEERGQLLSSEREAFAATRRELEEELERHRELLPPLEERLREQEREIEERGQLLSSEREAFAATRRELEEELERHRELLPPLEERLGEQERELEERGQLLSSEREAFAATRRELEEELERHRELLPPLERRLEEQARELEERGALLRREREAFVATRRELEEELERHRELLPPLERQLGEQAEELEERGRRLVVERAAFEEERKRLRGERQALLRQLVEQGNEIEARGEQLGAERAAFEALHATLKTELEALAGEVELRGGELQRQGGELDAALLRIAYLETELAGRWKNLKRALGKTPPV